jgi:hypothetical protein
MAANFDVAPDEEEEQFAKAPQLLPAQFEPAAGRLDAQGLCSRQAVGQRAGCERIGGHRCHSVCKIPD